jgi:hypothetical protein
VQQRQSRSQEQYERPSQVSDLKNEPCLHRR